MQWISCAVGCLAVVAAAAAQTPLLERPHPAAPSEVSGAPTAAAASGGVCLPDAETLCLGGGRFRVAANWQTQAAAGAAHAVRLGEDSGRFWFFDRGNTELVVKVLDGCAVNGRYWVFSGGLTNVGVDLVVEDLWSGRSWRRSNPLDKAYAPVQDTGALAICEVTPPQPATDLTREVVAADLRFAIASRRGVARLTLAPGESRAVSLAVGDLAVEQVSDGVGPLVFRAASGRLDVALRPGSGPRDITVTYSFSEHSAFDGFLVGGSTYTWPALCGNLYPCQPNPPAGLRAGISVTDLPTGSVAVAPITTESPGPSYMPAFAIGSYTYRALGTTVDGTEIGVWFLPGGESAALSGTAKLVPVFSFFERTYGAYGFGHRAGPVAVDWGAATGALETHPFWHVAEASMGNGLGQAHEAAHGWFGNGVRIACWEDFVLSEGAASYLAARATEAVSGPAAAQAVWEQYSSTLDAAIAEADTVARPAGCNRIDLAHSRLYSWIPYLKGALFLRAVEQAAGRTRFDAALASFYEAYRGHAASLEDLLAALRTGTGFDPRPLAEAWLQRLGRPDR